MNHGITVAIPPIIRPLLRLCCWLDGSVVVGFVVVVVVVKEWCEKECAVFTIVDNSNSSIDIMHLLILRCVEGEVVIVG